ncbi:MAG: hypothetical protein ACXAC7_04215 [Candidatus Hodarchaeales archaeon]|jgi:hypothetical protein
MNEYWKTTPISLLILQILEKRDGLILDNELLNLIEQELGYRPSLLEFNRELMNLEIHGKIYVINIKKNQRRISFIKKDHNFLAIGED